MTKSEIRAKYKSRRNEMSKARIASLSKRAAEHFFASDIYCGAEAIMLYMPIGSEADTSFIIMRALAEGKRIALPVTNADGIITPVYAHENTVFNKGEFSIPEPSEGQTASVQDIDVIIVPGIAFAKDGGRVGYGKGCYDRFLPSAKSVKIGYCFEELVCDRIDADSTDIPMDFLLTESGIIRCG